MSGGNEREFIDHLQSKEGKEQAMKCPMTFQIEITNDDEIRLAGAECGKEECAWWDAESSACAIWSLMSGLDSLGKLFREIEKKMPHAGQFTK